MTLRVGTMNIGRSGISKIPTVHDAILGLDVVSLQEVDVNRFSLAGFVQQWQRLDFHILCGRMTKDENFCRVALLSRRPLRQLDLGDMDWPDRYVAGIIELQNGDQFQKVIFICIYGHAGDTVTARAHAQQIVQRVGHFALPWVIVGDFNLQMQDLSMILANGWAHSLDEPFEATGPLPPTCTGQRRIDFGLAHRMHATSVQHSPGVADHSLVTYSFPLDHTQSFVAPKRATVDVATASEVAERWHLNDLSSFHFALERADVDAAWSALSNSAERALCSSLDGCRPRADAWDPRDTGVPHKAIAWKESLVLRQLRRLQRRVVQLTKQLDDRRLRSAIIRGAQHLRALFPCLDLDFLQSNLTEDQFQIRLSRLVEDLAHLINTREGSEQQARLVSWRTKMVSDPVAHRRWIKHRAHLKVMWEQMGPVPDKTPTRHAIHRQHVLDQAVKSWMQVWNSKSASPPDFQSFLDMTPRPTQVACTLAITGVELVRAAKTMVGKACGPDSWRVEDLLLLPMEWWSLFADWCLQVEVSQRVGVKPELH